MSGPLSPEIVPKSAPTPQAELKAVADAIRTSLQRQGYSAAYADEYELARVAIAAWNQRAPHPTPASDAERLVERLNDMADFCDSAKVGPHPKNVAKLCRAATAALAVQGGWREQGQAEGFAAAVAQLRDMSSIKPKPSLWHAASLLADSLERSRIPCAALAALPEEVGNG